MLFCYNNKLCESTEANCMKLGILTLVSLFVKIRSEFWGDRAKTLKLFGSVLLRMLASSKFLRCRCNNLQVKHDSSNR